jgi:hypothetical protein
VDGAKAFGSPGTLDCGEHHRFDAGSGFLERCLFFEKSRETTPFFNFPKSSPKVSPHPKAVILTALQSSACGGTLEFGFLLDRNQGLRRLKFQKA